MKVTIWHRRSVLELATAAGKTAEMTPEEISRAAEQMFRGYRPGDRVTRAYDYDVPAERGLPDPEALAAQAFRMFNDMPASDWERAQAERYYGGRNRSLSVGDIVAVGEAALSCEPQGWQPTSIDPGDEI